jgi:hypothetical protein
LDLWKNPANLILKELLIGGGCGSIAFHEYILPHFGINVNRKILKKCTFFTFLPNLIQKCQI